MRSLILLGATGSIGQSALDVLRRHRDRFRVDALAAGKNAAALAEAAREFRPRLAALADPSGEDALREALRGTDVAVRVGPDAAREAARAARPGSGSRALCLSAMVGDAGLEPTLEAIDAGCDIALANKETLVAGGALVMESVRSRGVALRPVDSEHSAIFQCLSALKGRPAEEIERLWLTASGGPFRGWSKERLAREASPELAGVHPTWRMGKKITVDSATLANKALEVIEAHWLFSVPYDKIGVLVHPESVVHGLVECRDGGVLAQLAVADMRVAIQYALLYPERAPAPAGRLDWTGARALHFESPDLDAFPLLAAGLAAGRKGGAAPAAFNAANERAVERFLAGTLPWTALAPAVEAGARAGRNAGGGEPDSVSAVRRIADAAREAVSDFKTVET